MCALKSIDVLGETKSHDLGKPLKLANTTFSDGRKRPCWWQILTCRLCRRQPIPVAEELLQLRAAFDHLHKAMLAWSKFVPILLLKQLFKARVEAHIGCCYCEVSVFFCDIHLFKELCERM